MSESTNETSGTSEAGYPTEEADHSDSDIWHKFIGDSRLPTALPKPQAHILCWAATDVKPQPAENGYLYVTLLNNFVTCQECLELIHA